MTGTVYPNSIDGNTQLPLAQDRVSPVSAGSVNRLRNAIIAVETELGINPSGIYGTLKDRLDAIDGYYDDFAELIIDFLRQASNITISDAGSYFVSSTVEGALQEIQQSAQIIPRDFITLNLETPTEKSYIFAKNIPYDGYIDSVTSICTSGTATGTVNIDGTPLGGGTNAISSVEDIVLHETDNIFVSGSDLDLTLSSVSSATDVIVTISFIKT